MKIDKIDIVKLVRITSEVMEENLLINLENTKVTRLKTNSNIWNQI